MTFDVELLGTTPDRVTDLASLASTYELVATGHVLNYMKQYCAVAEMLFRVDVSAVVHSDTDWTPDAAWSANLRALFPGADISPTTVVGTPPINPTTVA